MSNKIKIKHLIWAIVPITLGIVLAIITTKSIGYEKISKNLVASSYVPIQSEEIKKEKELKNFYFIKNPDKKPNVKAEAYYVGDLDTGEVILEKNKEKVFPIASVSKLMTATLSKEIQNQDDTVQITKKILSTYGENGDFHLNEKIKISDLIFPLLLESSNDAAEAIASSSGRDFFIKKMNQKANELNLVETSFLDPSGLSPENKSTAHDLFKFSMYLKTNASNLLETSTLKSYKNKNHIWFNNSQFLGLSGYQGGKRGYIDESKQTALSLFTLPLGKEGVRNIGIVVLRSPDRYKDVKNILNYLEKNVYYGGENDADMAWVKSKENISDESEQNFITLLFGGDMMLDRGVESSVSKNFNGDFSSLFNNLDMLKKADITFANLEGPASDQGRDMRNLYSFRMNPSVIPALKGAGFNVLSVANNHEGDWERIAYSDTLVRLKENELFYTGGGINQVEAEKPVIIEKYGMKIGFLGFSDVGPEWMIATDTQAGILSASNPRLGEIINNASKQVDYLIVSFHFGEEYKTIHNQRQANLAHKAIDNGAKIVIGSHPHVAQDTEVYKDGFIAYSLGNLIFDQYFSKATMQGTLLEIKLSKDGNMSVNKNTVKLNSVFQPEKIIKGVETKIKMK
ncbi:MAG TPA: CapA family protein [Candidatus Paceibacterota bacterium]|nr:CapA family protein [Candidatus Paceibacterota bacterium]HPT18374.1 CapA family protein [Candidatus Paceibacterota bacterium]